VKEDGRNSSARELVRISRSTTFVFPNSNSSADTDMQRFADVMTKGVPTTVFEEFRSSLCLTNDASTAGGVNDPN
jgi:hypothetical protein